MDSECAVVLTEKLADNGKEISLQETAERREAKGEGAGAIGSLEGLDRLDGFRAQDPTFEKRSAVVAWTASYRREASSRNGGATAKARWLREGEKRGEQKRNRHLFILGGPLRGHC